MHMRLRRIMGTVLFLITGILIFCGISEALRRKTAEATDMVHSFYEIEEDTLDVLFLGSSHLYYGVQPNELWRDHGITSYVMGSPEQTAATSYFLLKEAFTRQKPKVVVMESYYLWNGSLYNGESRLRQAFDGMQFGKTKIEMVQELLPEAGVKERLTYYLPFLKYHSRWSQLEDYDFVKKPFLKGARLDYTAVPVEDSGIPKKAASIPDNSMEYLEKIIQLCDENDTEFVMMAIPFGVETNKKRYKRRQGLNLTLETFLDEQEIPFLFYQRDYPDLIDFATDFRDKTHLNTAGAKKLTAHLGNWLVESYGISGHKEDPAYASWEDDLIKYDRESEWVKEHPPEAGA